MMQHLQSGQHLDAEQINAFAEGVLPPQERTASLAHLASCGLCRQVLFVAQQAIAAEAPLPEVIAEGWRERFIRLWQASRTSWFGPLPMGLAGLAAALVVVAAVSRQRYAVPVPPQIVAKDTSPQRPFVPPPVPPPPVASAPRALAKVGGSIHPPSPPPPPPAARQAPPALALRADRAPVQTYSFANRMVASAPLPVDTDALSEDAAAAPSLSAKAKRAPMVPIAGGALPIIVNNASRMEGQAAGMGVGAPVSQSSRGMTYTVQHDRVPSGALAEVSGSVTDPSGAAIHGALVTLRPADGAGVHSTRADAAGRFTLSALPAGSYALEIAAPGFSTVSQSISVGARDLAQLKTVLPVGAENATVTVAASGADLQTMNAATATMIDAAILPAMGRDASTLQAAAPLPSGLATRLSAGHGATLLAVDTGSTLFLSEDLGKHWEKVKPLWRAAIQKLVLVPGAMPAFQLTTAVGEVWSSADGKHWRRL